MTSFRIHILVFCAACLGLTSSNHAADTHLPPPENPLTLWYPQPAKVWNEALAIGNGRLGAMIFGGAGYERIQFNEDTIWTGQPHEYQQEGAVKYLPEIRRLLFAGKQGEAEALAQREFMAVPRKMMAYQPCGDLWLEFPGHETVTEYRRSLDLNTAVVTTRYRVGDTVFTREAFASYPDQVIVIRLTASRPHQLTFTARLNSPHELSKNRSLGPNAIGLRGKVQDGAIRYDAQLHAQVEDGNVSTERGIFTITGATSVTFTLSAATNFVNYRDVSGDPEKRNTRIQSIVCAKTYAQLLTTHLKDYQDLFNRFSFDLGTSPAARLPTALRLKAPDRSADPALVPLYFQFGRYLLISSSRPGSQPANLQGVWNDRLRPEWNSNYTTNINLQMNYWSADVANLAECAEPLYAMLDDLAVSGHKTAAAQYGARGWVLNHNTDLWRGTAPAYKSNHGIWPTGGAWLARQLWEHYLFSGDRDFLRQRAYPVLKGAAEFFADTLVRDPQTGWLINGPSNSPEHGGLVMGPTMDHEIIRDFFSSVILAAASLDLDQEFADHLRDLSRQIAPLQIGSHGQLQEWLEDKDDPNDTHLHASHLWGIFPGGEINSATPDIFNAARQSLIFRGDGGMGWSLGWKIGLWARLQDGDRAHRILMTLLRWIDPLNTEPVRHAVGGTYPNLFDACPPFEIDANLGTLASIGELLVHSAWDHIDLLPALPHAWPQGRITGLQARGGFTLDLAWKDGQLTSVTVHSLAGNPTTLRNGEHTHTLTLKKGESFTWNGR